jgi:hypothetical protein
VRWSRTRWTVHRPLTRDGELNARPCADTAARHALADLGVTLADLQDSEPHTRVPTLGKYLFTVIAAAGTGANRTHVTYWGRMAALWGDRRLNEIHASDIEGMKNVAAASARMTSRMSS